MISKKRLLLAAATEIADITGCESEVAIAAADKAFRVVAFHVISPLLDANEFDARPMYRERVNNEARDLMEEVDDRVAPDKSSMEIIDEQ